jgi:hypothetical protein
MAIPLTRGPDGSRFPAFGGMVQGSTSALVLALDPFGDMAGAGLAGASTGGDAESILAAPPIGMAVPLSSIVTATITAILALVNDLDRQSVSVAASMGARRVCVRVPLVASITEGQRGDFRLVDKAVSEDLAAEASEAAVSAAEAFMAAVGANSDPRA